MNTLELQQRLAALGFSPGALDGINGDKTIAALKAFQRAHDLDDDGVVGRKTLAELRAPEYAEELPQAGAAGNAAAILSMPRLRLFAPHGREDIMQAIAKAAAGGDFTRAGVASARRIQYFMAQTWPETGGLQKLVESLNYSVAGLRATFGPHRISDADCQRYGRTSTRPADQEAIANIVYGGEFGRQNLGNVQPRDGWLFRGSGDFETTGRANFRRAGAEATPELLRQPDGAIVSALRFWQDNNLNRFADASDLDGMRRRVNGGTNGLSEAREALGRAQRIFV